MKKVHVVPDNNDRDSFCNSLSTRFEVYKHKFVPSLPDKDQVLFIFDDIEVKDVCCPVIRIGAVVDSKHFKVYDSYHNFAVAVSAEKREPNNYDYVVYPTFDVTKYNLSTPVKNKFGFIGDIEDQSGGLVIYELAKK